MNCTYNLIFRWDCKIEVLVAQKEWKLVMGNLYSEGSSSSKMSSKVLSFHKLHPENDVWQDLIENTKKVMKCLEDCHTSRLNELSKVK